MLRLFIILSSFFITIHQANASTLPAWLTNLSSTIDQRVSVIENRDRSQLTCLALAVYYESRGESLRGQRAVASVVMNRVRSPRFPNTPCAVIFQRSQFSFVGGPLAPRGPSWDRALAVASDFIDAPSGDIPHLFFTNSSRLKGLRIGAHVFR